MQPFFHPWLGFSFMHAVASPAQTPEVLSAVREIQKLPGVRPTVGFELPDPWHAIPKHHLFLGTTQTSSNRFPVQSLPKVGRIILSAHHNLVAHHPSTSFRVASLLLQTKHPVLYFVPFYTLFLGLFLSPAWPTKTRKPSVEHEQSQRRGPPHGLALLRHPL